MVHPRAIRRSHRQRMKRRAAKLYPAKCAGKLADNLTACSCPMCGNRRKWFKERTIKEQIEIELDYKSPPPEKYFTVWVNYIAGKRIDPVPFEYQE